MTVSHATLPVYSAPPSTKRTWWGKKKKPTLHVTDSKNHDFVIGNKLIQNPKLGKFSSRKYALLHVQDQDGNIGYVKISKSKLLKLLKTKGEPKAEFKETTKVIKTTKAPDSDVTGFILEINATDVQGDKNVESNFKEQFDDALNKTEEDKIKELKSLGKNGYTPALHELGNHYLQSDDNEMALYYFKKAANLGYPPSKLELSRQLFTNNRNEEGTKWLLLAYEDGVFEAFIDVAIGKGSNIQEHTKHNAKAKAISFLENQNPEEMDNFIDIIDKSLKPFAPVYATNVAKKIKAAAEKIKAAVEKTEEPKVSPKRPRREAKGEKAAVSSNLQSKRMSEKAAESSNLQSKRMSTKEADEEEALDISDDIDNLGLLIADLGDFKDKYEKDHPEIFKELKEEDKSLFKWEDLKEFQELKDNLLFEYEDILVRLAKTDRKFPEELLYDLAQLYKSKDENKYNLYLQFASDRGHVRSQILIGTSLISNLDPEVQKEGLALLEPLKKYFDVRVAIYWHEILNKFEKDSRTARLRDDLRQQTQQLIDERYEKITIHENDRADWLKYLNGKIAQAQVAETEGQDSLEFDAYRELKKKISKEET